MTEPFTITAWAKNGRDVVTVQGPLAMGELAGMHGAADPRLGKTHKAWTEEEKSFLFRFRERRLAFPRIADALPGRSVQSCRTKYLKLKRQGYQP